jgi:hypothetical protein
VVQAAAKTKSVSRGSRDERIGIIGGGHLTTLHKLQGRGTFGKHRRDFVLDVQRGLYTMTEAGVRYDIVGSTNYKWLDRFEAAGPAGPPDGSGGVKSGMSIGTGQVILP